MDSDIRAILEAAVQAPSGENVQPWRFKVHEHAIELHHVDVDSKIYDSGNRGSFVAHGAALENMYISACSLGYQTRIELFPNPKLKTHIATFTLEDKAETSPDTLALASAISKRITNRNQYETKPLSANAQSTLDSLAASEQGVTYKRITSRPDILKLARVGSTNEEVMLQNKKIHDFFFEHVSWTKEEDSEKRVGFYIKTLGLPLPVQYIFRILKHWPAMAFLNTIGFAAGVGKGNTKTYSATSEIGILSVTSDSPEHFIATGRLLERIWLHATIADISLQPLAGTIFMNFYASSNTDSTFSDHELQLITEAMNSLRDIVGKGEIPTFMFRLGYGKPPEAHATRFPLEHFLI